MVKKPGLLECTQPSQEWAVAIVSLHGPGTELENSLC